MHCKYKIHNKWNGYYLLPLSKYLEAPLAEITAYIYVDISVSALILHLSFPPFFFAKLLKLSTCKQTTSDWVSSLATNAELTSGLWLGHRTRKTPTWLCSMIKTVPIRHFLTDIRYIYIPFLPLFHTKQLDIYLMAVSCCLALHQLCCWRSGGVLIDPLNKA